MPNQNDIPSMLARAFLARDHWRRSHPVGQPLTDRDIVVLSILAQLSGRFSLICEDARLATSLRELLPSDDRFEIRALDEAAARSLPPAIVLTPLEDLAESATIVRLEEAGHLVVVYGLAGTLALGGGREIQLRLLATINPCLWNSGLAFAVPRTGAPAVEELIRRLANVLGDQSLDPLQLYDELCEARRARPSEDSDADATARRDYVNLRRFVRGAIERAALSARRDKARIGPRIPVDWSSAFLMPAELASATSEAIDPVTEAEARARQARIEAEYLRAQLRALSIPREVDAHATIAVSGFFDVGWYVETYDVAPEAAIQHYIDVGFRAGNDPSPFFSTKFYLAAHADVRGHGFNPLLHYLMDGIYEGRAIEPALFVSQADWVGARS